MKNNPVIPMKNNPVIPMKMGIHTEDRFPPTRE